MDRARLRANTAERRRTKRTEERRLARAPVWDDLRAAFAATVAREEQAALQERGVPAGYPLPTLLRRAVSRDAIRRALVANEMLHSRRRLHPQPTRHTLVDKRGQALPLRGLLRYGQVVEAHIAGIDARVAQGKPVKQSALVASFFVNRIDALVHPLVEEPFDKLMETLAQRSPRPFTRDS